MSGSLPLVPGVIAPPAFSLHDLTMAQTAVCQLAEDEVA
jgi:hypothetical protein